MCCCFLKFACNNKFINPNLTARRSFIVLSASPYAEKRLLIRKINVGFLEKGRNILSRWVDCYCLKEDAAFWLQLFFHCNIYLKYRICCNISAIENEFILETILRNPQNPLQCCMINYAPHFDRYVACLGNVRKNLRNLL